MGCDFSEPRRPCFDVYVQSVPILTPLMDRQTTTTMLPPEALESGYDNLCSPLVLTEYHSIVEEVPDYHANRAVRH